MVDKNVYRETVRELKADLMQLETEENQLKSRLEVIRLHKEKITDTLSNFSFFLNEETSPGLTDAVRKLFSIGPNVWGSATKVRDGLKKHGFPLDNYTQPLAVIHTTLRRLEKQGELESKEIEGTTRYHLAGEREDEVKEEGEKDK